MSFDKSEMLPTNEAHQKLSAKGFYWGPGHIGTLAQHICKFQTPKRKVGVQYKSHCWYRLGRVTDSLLRVVRPFPNSSSLMPAQSQPCKSGLLPTDQKILHRTALICLFPASSPAPRKVPDTQQPFKMCSFSEKSPGSIISELDNLGKIT